MKDRIEQRLGVLVGLPLWAMGRAADLEWFQFGRRREVVDHQGRSKTVGDWALHIQCAWRLTSRQGIVVARQDLYEPPEASSTDEVEAAGQDRSSERGGPTRLDERTAVFRQALNVNSPIVESVQADGVGGLRITLSDDYLLEIRPDRSGEGEAWRLFEPYRATPHFVVSRGQAELE